MPLEERSCTVCARVFYPRTQKQTKCSRACKIKAYNKRYVRRSAYQQKLPSGTIGAISELVVAADLMARGFHVFRALSPSCCCDLVIIHEGELIAVEVRTATRNPVSGLVSFSRGINADCFGLYIPASDEVFYEASTPKGKEFNKLLGHVNVDSC